MESVGAVQENQGKEMKTGIRIAQPLSREISWFYQCLLLFSFVFITVTITFLVLEYLNQPLPLWLREMMNLLTSAF